MAAAKEAGSHALREASRRDRILERAAHDVKLLLDKECQQKAEQVIRSAFPDHSILGEEGASEGTARSVRWIVDPIDGTVNFFHGLSYWCSSIAVQVDGRTVAGAVYAPVLGELYSASLDTPAKRNGEPIHVSAVDRLDGVLALTGLEKSASNESRSMEVFQMVSGRVQKIRLLGAAALDICQVASGRADAFFEQGINIWDVAAGDIIVLQAGGRAEILQQRSEHRMRYFCSNGIFHDELKALLLPYDVRAP